MDEKPTTTPPGGDEVAKRIQLLLEHDPKPPFDAGSPEHADLSISAEVLPRRGALIKESAKVAKAAGSKI